MISSGKGIKMSYKAIKEAYEKMVSAADTTQNQLTEALATASAKTMATKAAASSAVNGVSKAQQISKSVFPEGQDRVVIPYERNLEPNSNVVKHLTANGYKITDYSAGLASKIGEENRPMRIGKILNRTGASDDLFRMFDKDPARQGIKTNEHHIVISRHPYDVAAMSSGQNWESCQTLKQTFTHKKSDGTTVKYAQDRGSRSEMVPGIIASGAHVAYLVKDPKDVDKHFGPLARITMNAFHSNNGHTILRPSEEYGERYAGFHDTMKRWSEKHFPAKDAVYYRDDNAYPEGPQKIVDYSPKHDDHWKDEYFDREALINHPSSDVHAAWVDGFTKNIHSHIGHALTLMHNPKLSTENSDKLFNSISNSGLDQMHRLAEKAKTHDQIEAVMQHPKFNKAIAVHLAGNENATSEQLHKLLDQYGTGDDAYSDRIVSNVAMNRRSNDTHYRKILDKQKLNPTDHSFVSNMMDLAPAIDEIAAKYQSEDIAQKLAKHPVVMPGVTHHIALKHLHLLSQINTEDVRRAVMQHGMNKNLQDFALKSGHTGLIKAAITAHPISTGDVSFFDQFAHHGDPQIREHAANQKRLFTLAKESQ